MNQTSPFKDIAEQMSASWEARPSLLEFVGNIPDSVAALRMRWYEVFRSIYVDFIREINHWALSEEEAERIVDERVGQHVNNCCAMELDAQHLWAFLRLTGKEDQAKLFEYADSTEFCSSNRLETA